MADIQEELKKLNNTKDVTDTMEQSDIDSNKVMGIIAYLWILFLVPIFAAPNSKFAKFHANQGLVLFIVDIAVAVVGAILNIIPLIGGLIGLVLNLCTLALTIIGVINAATGKAKELPLIGNITILK